MIIINTSKDLDFAWFQNSLDHLYRNLCDVITNGGYDSQTVTWYRAIEAFWGKSSMSKCINTRDPIIADADTIIDALESIRIIQDRVQKSNLWILPQNASIGYILKNMRIIRNAFILQFQIN